MESELLPIWKLQDLKDFIKPFIANLTMLISSLLLEPIKFEDALKKRFANNILTYSAPSAPREVHTIEPKQVGEKTCLCAQKKS